MSFLKEYISSYESCDFVVADKDAKDQKPIFRVGHDDGADIKVPFSKELLLKKLDQFYKLEVKKVPKTHEEEKIERAIKELEKEHQKKIELIVKSYYEKR